MIACKHQSILIKRTFLAIAVLVSDSPIMVGFASVCSSSCCGSSTNSIFLLYYGITYEHRRSTKYKFAYLKSQAGGLYQRRKKQAGQVQYQC